jgi:hypothetical protein
LIVAQNTSSSIFFQTGRLSPVNIDSSILDSPSIITPSKGTFSPAGTDIISHTFISSIFTSSLVLLITLNAFFAHSSISFEIASPALFFALNSRYFHKLIKVMIATAASK